MGGPVRRFLVMGKQKNKAASGTSLYENNQRNIEMCVFVFVYCQPSSSLSAGGPKSGVGYSMEVCVPRKKEIFPNS